MNLPNKLSLFRILIIPPLLVAMLWGGAEPDSPLAAAWFRLAALVMVVAATITDWLDGWIARRRNLSTRLGKLLDPLADKLLVATAFVAFIDLHLFPSWLIVIILCREFLVTGLRALAASEGVVLAADRWGKHKTGWQLATIITTMVFVTAREFLRASGHWAPDAPLLVDYHADAIFSFVLHGLLLVAVALTVISGWLYLVRNKGLLAERG